MPKGKKGRTIVPDCLPGGHASSSVCIRNQHLRVCFQGSACFVLFQCGIGNAFAYTPNRNVAVQTSEYGIPFPVPATETDGFSSVIDDSLAHAEVFYSLQKYEKNDKPGTS